MLANMSTELRPFIPEIISGSKHFDQTLTFSFILTDDDSVDTTLKLSTAFSTIQNHAVAGDQEDVDTSLSLFRTIPPVSEPRQNSNSSITSSLSFSPPPSPAYKRKRGDEATKKRGKRCSDDEERRRPPCLEEFPGLVRALEGNEAVFLYRKRLEGSDVKGDLNRMFVTRRERLMEALTEEEKAAINGGNEGLVVVGLDEGGRIYKLGLKKWRSLNMMVINCDWKKMVVANNAAKGHEAYIWGFRRHGKLGLAIAFKP